MHMPDRIIDSHIHLITAGTHQARLEWKSKLDADLLSAFQEHWERSLRSRNEDLPETDPGDVVTVAARWLEEFDRAGIERGVFFTAVEKHDELARFIALGSGRFIGYASLNPTVAGNGDLLRRMVREHGIKGLKLYPMAGHFHVNDPACFPVYKACQENGLPVIIHFGLSINATHDLSYGNPLDLAAPALRFPSVKWIIPHFGAGFFREALLVAAQYRNVFIDTSSSNNWIQYAPEPVRLEEIFQRAYEALGANRIIFGTDSSFFPRGYRANILEQQLAILNHLGLSGEEINDIFGGNIEGILKL